MNKYIALDTETGGIGNDKTLLTAYLTTLDEKLSLENSSSLQLKLKPDDGVYHLAASGMAVNRINLVEHDKDAVTYTDAKSILYNWLSRQSGGGKIKLVPIGHNVHFDIGGIQNKILSKQSWDNFVSYRTLDTGCVAQFLISIRVLDGAKTTGSMESLAKYLDVTHETIGYTEPKLHDAEYDVKLTIAVLQKMQRLTMGTFFK